ncbi:eukaryotic-type carbonic anhydrase domain-containing protein [Ditylenchus destructor]|uniref:Carbonic anhydrase n=1 Tax=Ditylenchus destructor TaxID=166010 RepID=A0AAD4QXP1_9BILA|nr:eukaryotic-type carbonic anhydrase domain-containing protein [Ditylenchus destructor]
MVPSPNLTSDSGSILTRSCYSQEVSYEDSNSTNPLIAFGSGGNWGYGPENGPDKWPNTCHFGQYQSPISIDTKQLVPKNVAALQFGNYNTIFTINGEHVGTNVLFTGFSDIKDKAPYIYGGGLPGKYLLNQFHFHWSKHFNNGSEHVVNSVQYPVEIHMVHIREDLTLEQAYNVTDGVAVLGIFGDFGNESKALEAITPHFGKLITKGDKAKLSISPNTMLPRNVTVFYNYEGSLTTPGCFETVDWLIFHEPVSITPAQLEALRKIELSGKPAANIRFANLKLSTLRPFRAEQ